MKLVDHWLLYIKFSKLQGGDAFLLAPDSSEPLLVLAAKVAVPAATWETRNAVRLKDGQLWYVNPDTKVYPLREVNLVKEGR